MVVKRKHEAFEASQQGDIVAKPAAGTKTFTTGVSVREGLSSGSRQAFVAFHQQILTSYSSLPLPITHPTVVILQHYQSASPTFDEIFNAWREGDKARNERNVEAAASLLTHMLQIMSSIPFFRAAVLSLVGKMTAHTEPYGDLLNRLVLSGKREHVLIGLQLAAAAVHFDKPEPSAGSSSSAGRLAVRVWTTLVEGNSVKILGKVLGMRRRNKEGTLEYGTKDPLDKPDIRHAALHLVTPLLSLPAFHAQTKMILPAIYNNIQGDPPITIYRLLTGLWDAINGPSIGISRRAALALLDENAIEKLLGLVNREDVDPITGKTVGDLALAFLDAATTVPGRGICFPDEGWYPRRTESDKNVTEEGEERGGRDWKEGRMRKGLHNRILSNVVRKLGSRVVDDQGKVGDWVIKVLHACPEIIAGYWPHSALSLDPKLNPRWLATVSYVGRIISLPPPPMSTFYEPLPKGTKGIDYTSMPPRTRPPSVNVMVESIFPAPLGKVHLSKGLQHADHLVQHITALSLARGLQKLDEVQGILRKFENELDSAPGSSENPWMKGRLELEIECRRRVPEVLVVISFAQKSATLARVNPDTDEEPDPKLVARSAMLTEVALRLFGLYHKTMPSVSREAKFDIGKLLVSASSAKAERRERREAREGSVISDTGSVGSIGTIGTVGMGGGFGQSRGDVDGFEALSQVHVLSLLTDVKDWQWTNKASGSQYSYLYHILVLHLATPHPITHRMTSSLLDRLLLNSIMFEHDHSELDIWLSALPSLSVGADLSQRAFLTVQQIHLLSFLDECVRRCMKTPYRYIEESLGLLPEYFIPTVRPFELISPLMMTMVEQLRAKINGQHIATEAAGVVLAYLRRVVLGLAGKMKDGKWLKELVKNVETVVIDARGKGQERKGLLGSIQGIQSDLQVVFGGTKVDASEEGTVVMVDEEEWTQKSFEKLVMSEVEDKTFVVKLLSKASAGAVERYGRFGSHLFASSGKGSLLAIVQQCLVQSEGIHADRLRQAVFEEPTLKAAMLPGSSVSVGLIDPLVNTLRLEKDGVLAVAYVHDLVEILKGDKKGKNFEHILPFVHPWTRLFGRTEAQEAVTAIVKNLKRLPDPTTRVRETVSRLIVATNDPAFALHHLGKFVAIGIIDPFISLLATTAFKDRSFGALEVSVDTEALRQILETKKTEAYGLVRTLVQVSPAAMASFIRLVKEDRDFLQLPKLLETFAVVLEMPDALDSELHGEIAKTAVGAMSSQSFTSHMENATRRVLRRLAGVVPDTVNQTVCGSSATTFTPAMARLAKHMAKNDNVGQSISHLVALGLRYLTRLCSSDSKLEESHFIIFSDLSTAITQAKRIDLDADLVEPVVIAIVQDRMSTPEALSFAALLVEQSTLKASFIRQHLSLLFSSTTYNTLSSPAMPSVSPVRGSFVHFLTALFIANPYISCQPNFVEQLLPLYRGTLSMIDQRLLSAFNTFESYRHVSVLSVLSAWSAGAGRSSRAYEAVTGLDPGKMFATAVCFPLKKGVRSVEAITENDQGSGLYDPTFVLALFAAMTRENLTGLDWVEVLRTNILGVAVAALSSRDAEMRSLGGFALSKTMASMNGIAFQEKPQLVYILRLIRHSIPHPSTSISGSKGQPRLPVIITSFLAHTLRTLASPSNPLYASASRFLLQRPKFDAGDVPMLFGMLYASGEGHRRDRNWIVRLIKDSTRSEADWRLLKRRKTVELLQTLYSSSLDINFRRLILQAVERIMLLPPAVMSLVHRNHLLTWLETQWLLSDTSPTRGVEEERGRYLAIMDSAVIVLAARDKSKTAKAAAKTVEDEDEEDEKKDNEAADEIEVVDREWSMKNREWVGSVERLVKVSVAQADIERLTLLVQTVRRLADVPITPIIVRLLPLLVSRLKTLYPESSDDEAYIKIIEMLFETTMVLPCQGESKLKEAVREVGWSAGMLDTDIGDWVKAEQRRFAWEKYSASRV